MKNNEKAVSILNSMIEEYNRLSYTHLYIFGFIYKGSVYAVEVSSDILPYILTLDKASSKNGGGYSLRFCPRNEQKVLLLSKGATLICSEDYFKNAVSNSKYNAGEIFEKLCTERAGQVWTKDNLSFVEGGDLDVDGKSYQIKFQKATFTNEKTLMNFVK